MSDDEDRVDETELSNWTVHAGEKISEGFTEGDQEGEELGGRLVEFSVLFTLHVNVDDLCTNEELQDHT